MTAENDPEDNRTVDVVWARLKAFDLIEVLGGVCRGEAPTHPKSHLAHPGAEKTRRGTTVDRPDEYREHYLYSLCRR